MEKRYIQILENQSLLRGFTVEELDKIKKILKKRAYPPNQVIIEEGETSAELYLIVDGEVKILKWDEDQLSQFAFGKLVPGDTFGEMSFLDSSPRTATIETVKNTTLYELSRKDLEMNLPEMQDIYNKIIANIAKINIERLRSANQIHVKKLISFSGEMQNRLKIGAMLLCFFIFLGVINLLTLYFGQLYFISSSDITIWSFWVVLLLPVLFLMEKYHLSISQVGINNKQPLKVLKEASIVILVGIPVFYLTHLIYQVSNESTPPEMTWSIWMGGYLIYCFVYELIARGYLQSSIKTFIDDKNGVYSVILTSILISALPLISFFNIPWSAVLLTFVANICLGSIYLRHENLLGVTLIHFILGAYGRYLQSI